MLVKVKKFSPSACLPEQTYAGDACYDLFACEDYTIPSFTVVTISTGIGMEIPDGFEGQVRSRSGLARRGVFVILGTVDSGYRNEIKVNIFNSTPQPYIIKKFDRIAQIAIRQTVTIDFIETEELTESFRGLKGFGSSGR